MQSEIREYDIELWPGYVTSIRQHDKGVLMCAEVSHKVMRIDTVYNILLKIINENRRYGRDYQVNYNYIPIHCQENYGNTKCAKTERERERERGRERERERERERGRERGGGVSDSVVL